MLSYPPKQLESERRRACEASPEEICGLMLGKGDRVHELIPTRNVHPDRRQGYRIAPEDCLAALKKAREKDLEVLGVFHSHPEGPDTLSAIDRREAHRGWRYLVLGRDGECTWEA